MKSGLKRSLFTIFVLIIAKIVVIVGVIYLVRQRYEAQRRELPPLSSPR